MLRFIYLVQRPIHWYIYIFATSTYSNIAYRIIVLQKQIDLSLRYDNSSVESVFSSREM